MVIAKSYKPPGGLGGPKVAWNISWIRGALGGSEMPQTVKISRGLTSVCMCSTHCVPMCTFIWTLMWRANQNVWQDNTMEQNKCMYNVCVEMYRTLTYFVIIYGRVWKSFKVYPTPFKNIRMSISIYWIHGHLIIASGMATAACRDLATAKSPTCCHDSATESQARIEVRKLSS